MKKTKILFITWDGPQTNYLEGLSMPLFAKIMELNPHIEFHCLQFTWAENLQLKRKYSKRYNIPYSKVTIVRKPSKYFGSLLSIIRGSFYLRNYVKINNIDVLMPRSNFPAFVTILSRLKLPLIFDADGIPIEERVDFSNLSRKSLLYRLLRLIEGNTIKKADIVLTRSHKAIEYHLQNYNILDRSKFHVVMNGRDKNSYMLSSQIRTKIRCKFNFDPNTKVFIYVGSCGPQYCISDMINIFEAYYKKYKNAHFIILTGSPDKMKEYIPNNLLTIITIKRVPYETVPQYLNAADIAFALRKPTLSMQGVAPIKLGEYLLMGIPTIASDGIGDTNEIIQNVPGTLLYYHDNPPTENEILAFIDYSKNISKDIIRQKSLKIFSLTVSANSYLEALEQIK